MQLSWENIQANALLFSKKWKDGSNEIGEAQPFTVDFLNIFGVDNPVKLGDFEYWVTTSDNKRGRIDYLWKKKIAIEMKSKGKDLGEAYKQLQSYMPNLHEEDVPDLLMVCDFEYIHLYRRSTDEFHSFMTKDLHKNVKRFADIAGYSTERVRKDQLDLNIKAAEKMAKLHETLKSHGYEGHELEVYLVRLLFCLFAGDTGIFPKGNFYYYIRDSKEDGSDLSNRISNLFEVLNMPDDLRAKRTLLSDELKAFRYINGALFEERLPPADFDAKTRKILLECREFDWSEISPAIFGAMFQGVMDKEKRREFGAHYTSEENILKLINPLFLDDLYKEFEKVKTDPIALERFHDKIARFKFLDPACGCGNFLIITYRELRLLELQILKMQVNTDQLIMDISPLLKVTVEQFYGIELEDFPCQIAQVGLWLTDHQMNVRASELFGTYYTRLPLTRSATIVHANALRIEWEDVVPKSELSYILGNPPFVGCAWQTDEQRADMNLIFQNEVIGQMDYVATWFKKTSLFIHGTRIMSALVSTNSICQGEQVARVWESIVNNGINIDFAYRTFKWSNEAKGKAAVHCVIIGFSYGGIKNNKFIIDQNEHIAVEQINPYLVEAPTVFISPRNKPICDVPLMRRGNTPYDGGHLLLSPEERDSLIQNEPLAEKYIRRFSMGQEYINNIPRYCLWLVDASPNDLKQMPEVLKRIQACKEARIISPDAGRRRCAETPSLFREQIAPDHFLVVPKVSSITRKYIPIGYMDSSTIAGDKLFIVANAQFYHFGILTSNVHMAWVRAICGRLKSDYSYSNTIVYNNFPWPNLASENQKLEVEAYAKAILDTREQYNDSTLAALYDPRTMPAQLLKAHQNLDRVVLKSYGFATKRSEFNEADCVAALMERYQKLITN